MTNIIKHCLIFFLFSCASKAQDCEDIFKNAARTYDNYLFSRDIVKLDSALFFVDQALMCAPDNSLTKLLKVKILFANHDYKSVLIILQDIDPNNVNPEVNSLKGFTFERLHQIDSSKRYFVKSLIGYSELLKSDSSNFSNLISYFQMVYIVKSNEEFEREVDNYEGLILIHEKSAEVFKKGIIESYRMARIEQ